MSSAKILCDYLMRHSDVADAQAMAAYMKHNFRFFGIKGSPRKQLLRSFLKEHPFSEKENVEEILQLVRDLWNLPERELQYCGQEILIKHHKLLRPEDLPFLEELITTHSWWDTVDSLASNILGPFFNKYPDLTLPTIDKWISSKNIWLHRCCILFQLKFRASTNTRLLTLIILELKDSNELFIRKAIGWALREYSKTDPECVRNFTRYNPLLPLSFREAAKHLI